MPKCQYTSNSIFYFYLDFHYVLFCQKLCPPGFAMAICRHPFMHRMLCLLSWHFPFVCFRMRLHRIFCYDDFTSDGTTFQFTLWHQRWFIYIFIRTTPYWQLAPSRLFQLRHSINDYLLHLRQHNCIHFVLHGQRLTFFNSWESTACTATLQPTHWATRRSMCPSARECTTSTSSVDEAGGRTNAGDAYMSILTRMDSTAINHHSLAMTAPSSPSWYTLQPQHPRWLLTAAIQDPSNQLITGFGITSDGSAQDFLGTASVTRSPFFSHWPFAYPVNLCMAQNEPAQDHTIDLGLSLNELEDLLR